MSRIKLKCGCNYNRSKKGSFQIISCKKHNAANILAQLPIRELEFIGVALNDIVHVEDIKNPNKNNIVPQVIGNTFKG